ncbi:MAG: winged helix-turn-helix transcriptional regulator [Treponema sp.]|nr:winged helix-turn-helix transcriptional regulator [Treponema sp.]
MVYCLGNRQWTRDDDGDSGDTEAIASVSPDEGTREETTQKTGFEVTENLEIEETREKTREKFIDLISEDNGITPAQIAEELSISEKGVEWQLKQFKDAGLIRRVGPDKGGHWEVIKE